MQPHDPQLDGPAARIESARLPDPRLYLDPELFQGQRERVFARAWHYAGDAAELEPGSTAGATAHLLPCTLAPGVLDEPLLWVQQEQRRALLSNVCTHRGHLLVEQACSAQSLRCGYHGRRFDLQGRHQHSPGFEGALDFPRPEDNLPQVAHAQFGPLLFAALGARQGFEQWLGSLPARFAHLGLERARFEPARSRDYEFQAHWALYCDNYLEGLHIPFVHPGLNQELEFESYRTLLEPWGVLQIAAARPGASCFELPASHPEAGQRIAAWYAWLFPNTMLNVYPWGLSLNQVLPLGPARTRVRFRSYVLEPRLLDTGAGSALHAVELEDERALESVQRGVASRLFQRGRYSPRWETGTHHFQRLLCAALGAAD